MMTFTKRTRKIAASLVAVTLILTILITPATWTIAADHGDSPNNANDRAGDLGDTYLFLDPNDNTKVIMLTTVQGFIVPGEAVNFAIFDHNLRFRFELETTGDAVPDHFIDVFFSEKVNAANNPQVATISSTFFPTFTGNTTPSSLGTTVPNPTITTSAAGISFFAGQVDDPFFFDIPAFSRFNASVGAGNPDPTQFNRGRDTFAGYSTLGIALSVPLSLINPLMAGSANSLLGLDTRTARRQPSSLTRKPVRGDGGSTFVDVDRDGNPAVNALLIPYARKNEYNTASGADDAAGRFANDLVAALQRFGTNNTNINALASVVVAKGDYLRCNLGLANTGTGGGTNAPAAFPNGRRLGDDVVDILLTIIANGTKLGDNVDANDVAFRDTFPFFAPQPQPFDKGVIDDRTRN
ncbi:MAG: DUF4331 family protein [Blastocatellia bacterium]